MLIKRAKTPCQGDWDIPGGFMEFGEHPSATAKREVFEETGFEIQITGLLGIWMDEYGPEPIPELRDSTLNIYYCATLCDNSLERLDPLEVAEIGWFLPDQLPSNIAFPDHECKVLRTWQRVYLNGLTSLPCWDGGEDSKGTARND
jgi:ADP-ribose pyrophosphatase YjhB (NUDIX family)